MKLLNNYVMFNPYEHTRTLTNTMLRDINESINHQIDIIESEFAKWHIEEVQSNGNYYIIAFCLNDYKHNDFALNWEVQVKKDIIHDYVAENYEDVPEYFLEEYFVDNDHKIALEWLNDQDLEELTFNKIVA